MHFRKWIFVMAVISCLLVRTACLAAYIDNGDGTVTDTDTGLMWQQSADNDTYTWEQALTYCENLELAAYMDWRMPTAKELVSLVAISQYGPSIDGTYFPDTVTGRYWTSTTPRKSPAMAWYVAFLYGYLQRYDKAGANYVRAVRAGGAAASDTLTLWPVPDTGQTQSFTDTFGEDHDYIINPPSYTKLADDCIPLQDNATTWSMVRDAVTGLVWEEKHAMDNATNYADPNDADNTYTWYNSDNGNNGGDPGTPGDGTDTEDFIAAMNAAAYGGYDDWRMPNEKELQTLVDYGRLRPAINLTYFPGAASAYYWSSASFAANAGKAWAVDFRDGAVDNNDKSYGSFYARAVRAGKCSCRDTDGDGYGYYCAAGLDCNDNDSFYNDFCPDCEVHVIPKAMGRFLGDRETTRRLLVIGTRGTVFDETTPVRWETDGIQVLNKGVYFQRFMLMKVRIDGGVLDNGQYRALIGDCSGKLSVVKQ